MVARETALPRLEKIIYTLQLPSEKSCFLKETDHQSYELNVQRMEIRELSKGQEVEMDLKEETSAKM